MNDEEKKQFIDELMKCDGQSSNPALKKSLKWSDDLYNEVRAELLELGRIVKTKGRGGGVKSTDPAKPADSVKKTRIKETSLYGPMSKVISSWLRSEIGYKQHNFITETCGNKRSPGLGKWAQPDIVSVGYRVFEYLLPSKYLDIISYEVKTEQGWDMTSVYEASAHLRYVNYSYLIVHGVNTSTYTDREFLESVRNECERQGVGLIFCEVADESETWEIDIKPAFNIPEPEKADDFVRRNFSEKNRRDIANMVR